MRKFFLLSAFIFTSNLLTCAQNAEIVEQKQGSITFVVDEKLPKPEKKVKLTDGMSAARSILVNKNIRPESQRIVACSFENDRFCVGVEDAFYKCIIEAYAGHYSVVLSPDMIWLLISQGFARYVNAHPEEMQNKLVYHDGKLDIVVLSSSSTDLKNKDWSKLLNAFERQISEHTKGDIANIISADFSTTTLSEKIASQITLMDCVKPYFIFREFSAACGIPQITIKGTAEDWKRVVQKTRQLGKYGMERWTYSLIPVLEEFVAAAEGNPNKKFWKGIVNSKKVGQLERGGGCGGGNPTMLDGWILRFFPDRNGKTSKKVTINVRMPEEVVGVNFISEQFSPDSGKVTESTQMELYAGFIGYDADTISNTFTPKIGWIVREEDTEQDALDDLNRAIEKQDGSIHLRVRKVPTMLAELKHIEYLSITFIDKVEIPEWMDNMKIDYLYISCDEGMLSDEEKAALVKRFPQIRFSK